MKHLFFYLMMAAAALTVASCGGDDDPSDGGGTTTGSNVNKNSTATSTYASNLEFPRLQSSNLLIVHTTAAYGMTYALEWNPSLKSQRWSCYQLHAANSVKNTSRWTPAAGEDQYPQDPDLPVAYRFSSDPFWGTGYDHGHICNSQDRLASEEVNKQTFYLTNMQPQVNGFNAGVWLNMENQLNKIWNKDSFRDTLFVCKGGTIETTASCPNAVKETTKKGLLVPNYYYMAILCKKGNQYKALAFWAEHKVNNDTNLRDYVISIDELEQKTGIDFFCNLPDNIENQVESRSTTEMLRAWGL